MGNRFLAPPAGAAGDGQGRAGGRGEDEGDGSERVGGKSAERALTVLEVLARHVKPVPTMVIARECGMPKSSAHRLLNVMRERRFVTYYDAEHAWGLGVSVFEIGSAYLRQGPVQRLGRPILAELCRQARATTHLAILHGTEVLYLDKETQRQSGWPAVTEVGVRLPAHLTAVGRAILANLPEAQVRALYGDRPLVRRTGRGPATVDQLLPELGLVHESAIAIDDQMVEPQVSCIAAPVFSHEGVPVAAIGLSFDASRRARCHDPTTARLVRVAAARLSTLLGAKTVAT